MNPFDTTGPSFDDMPLFDMPATPISVQKTAARHRLRTRLLRAGRAAVDLDLLDGNDPRRIHKRRQVSAM
ncbi:MAG: hypothetical protein F4X40_09415 [Chloroflexi bacterium]|nr:hypothetical protein [Chloroflexota bacterium]